MPVYRAPGTYVEEVSPRHKRIEGVSTTTTAFVGPTLQGPETNTPPLLTSFHHFERHYGGLGDIDPGNGQPPATNHVAHAARVFFAEGGKRLYIARTPTGDDSSARYEEALAATETLADIATVAAPGNTTLAVARALMAHATRPGLWRFAVLDAPLAATLDEVREHRRALDSPFAALYHPWVVSADPGGQGSATRTLPPSGFVCGIYARSDVERGVHKAPANEVVRGALRFERDIREQEQSVLNPEGINCLRFLEGRGMRVWGARTLGRDPEWTYVNTRRCASYLQASIERGTRWAAFEPNGEPLWARATQAISDFLHDAWRNGALRGDQPAQAFFVRCDRSTMTQNDIDNGRMVCLIGVAILKPAEFVIFRVVQTTA